MTQETLDNKSNPEMVEPKKMTRIEELVREIEKVKRKVDTICEIRQMHLKEMENLKKVVGNLCETAQSQMASYYFSENDYQQALFWVRRERKTAGR